MRGRQKLNMDRKVKAETVKSWWNVPESCCCNLLEGTLSPLFYQRMWASRSIYPWNAETQRNPEKYSVLMQFFLGPSSFFSPFLLCSSSSCLVFLPLVTSPSSCSSLSPWCFLLILTHLHFVSGRSSTPSTVQTLAEAEREEKVFTKLVRKLLAMRHPPSRRVSLVVLPKSVAANEVKVKITWTLRQLCMSLHSEERASDRVWAPAGLTYTSSSATLPLFSLYFSTCFFPIVTFLPPRLHFHFVPLSSTLPPFPPLPTFSVMSFLVLSALSSLPLSSSLK